MKNSVLRNKTKQEMLENIEHMLTLLLILKSGLEEDRKSIEVSSTMFRLVDLLCDTEISLYNYFEEE